jgi:TPR repeat protein
LKQGNNNSEEGQRLIEQAAELGHDNALYFLAVQKVGQGRSAEAIEPLTQIAKKGGAMALGSQYQLARILTMSSDVYDPDKALFWLRQAMTKGPWLTMALTAEEYWRDGNFIGAVLLWMELADCGIPVGAYNAGLALLELKSDQLPFDKELRAKLAVRMFKQFSEVSDGDVAVYLLRAYDAHGKQEKGLQKIVKKAAIATSVYRLIELHLDGRFPMTLCGLFGNVSRVISLDLKYILPVSLLVPEITRVTIAYVSRCLRGECRNEELNDLSEFVVSCWKGSKNVVSVLLGIAALVLLARRRITLFYRE